MTSAGGEEKRHESQLHLHINGKNVQYDVLLEKKKLVLANFCGLRGIETHITMPLIIFHKIKLLSCFSPY